MTGSGTFIADNSPINHRARFNGIIYFVFGIGFAIGPLLFGVIIKQFGFEKLWFFCFVIELASSILMKGLSYVENNAYINQKLKNEKSI